MIEIGVALVLVGAALLVAEAHMPAGILGVLGAAFLAGGAALAIAGAGAALAVVLAGVIAALAASGLWLAIATRKALATRRLRPGSGREALSGRVAWCAAGPRTAAKCSSTARSGAPGVAGPTTRMRIWARATASSSSA